MLAVHGHEHGPDEALRYLRQRGYVVLPLNNQERHILSAAHESAEQWLSNPTADRDSLIYRGCPRHPVHDRIALHGLGYVFQSGYADRKQLHWIAAARDVMPWPCPTPTTEGGRGEGEGEAAHLQKTFEAGAAVLSGLCQKLLEQIDPNAVSEWKQQILADGDPSVCDAFLYPGRDDEKSLLSDKREAMCSHLDPGWFTVKQGSLDGGLELFDPTSEEWVNVESAAFFRELGVDPESVAICFAGERLMSWTEENDLESIPAVHHRALTCPNDRISFIFELRDHVC
mmetsp:Transcript_26318/g.40004  ORF Transcript_26318/g.40004 Transcript_26318/m.40004 type:complete len:285 (-) Transcript_26318:257-1111(-)|eukprot:CAMPEP_0206576122 /NCGR_PEP_ID=MMETSP0325_2-20121206/30545_1 /ASSEMBLY_ACC=CAM_ASM_000347 /TAXON_ID=2866 /ORGANISM="Crypthecodinium cohnii, Strain Seligo" /LENGTH=284 /DNA_ID=CAMNT_0054081241 /DNA_START=37 /DNA_END=891 /DNA_ORIENTATION=+